MHPTHLPIRLTTGAFILNSGLGKLNADEGTAEYLHGAAVGAYPFLKDMNPRDFAQLLAVGEIAIGGALLLPFVPSTLAGAALTGFGASLIGMYLRTPGMTEEDGIRPTQDGIAVAKDIWLVGAGLTLATQGALSKARSGAKKLGKKARNAVPLAH